jgi:trigger factor
MNELAQNTSQDIEYPILNVEEIEYCKLKAHYEADPEVVNSKIAEAMVELRKIKIPGFRKGKAPDNALKIRLRPQISQYIAREMAIEAIDSIQFETDCKPIGQPKFSNIKVNGNKFSCDIELNKKPEFEIQEFKFEIPKPSVKVDEEALAEKSLLNLRYRVGDVEPYEDNDLVEIGDNITLSFNATIQVDGKIETFEGSTVEGELYTIGTNRWSGFDDCLIGMKVDQTKKFDFVFEDGNEDIIGKTAQFEVTVHMGTKRKPHPINDEFYNLMGVENIEKLMEKLRSISKASITRSIQEQIRKQVSIRLIQQNKFDVPQFFIEDEAKSIADQSGINFNENLSEEDKEKLLQKAENNIRLTLILDSIRDQEPDSVLNDTEAKNYIINHMKSQGQDPETVFKNPAMHNQLSLLINNVKDEFTLQWVANQATLIE